MKLYEVSRQTKIRVVGGATIPPCAPKVGRGEVLDFYHIDGAYSYCKNSKGEVVHLSATTEVEIVN